MKKVMLLTAGMVIGIVQSLAQGKYGKNPQDSIKCVEGLSLYKDFLKTDALKAKYYWLVPFSLCPASSEKMYLDGAAIYDKLIKDEKDLKRKEELIDTLLLIYDKRIENFGKEALVLGYKGSDLYRLRPAKTEEAYNYLKKSVTTLGNGSLVATIQYLMMASADLEKKGILSADKVVEDYHLVSAIAEWNVKNNEKYAEYYATALDNIQKVAAPYLTCEVMADLVKKNFETNQNNIEWLRKMATMLDNKNCNESPEYIKVAEKLYQLEPSAEAAKNMAMVFFGKKQYNNALEYIGKAIEQETDNQKKADYYIKQAAIHLKAGNYAAVKTSALKALSINPNLGHAYLLIGDAYAAGSSACDQDACTKGMVYLAAIEKYAKAKAVDPSVSAEAQARISSYNAYIPKKEDCFFQGIKEGDSFKIECWINETVTVRTK